jgi:hypothetical protein
VRPPRLAVVLGLAGAVVLGGAGPAAADPAGPSDYRSEVTSIEPPVDGVTVEVLGGDAFLRVTVEPGHEVVIEGYDGEPYLRINPDGTVEENQRSPATYLNQDRYGRVDVSGVDADAEPEWKVIDDDGEIAWHDHRIHWMSPDRRPGVGEGEVVLDWEVPMVVDGQRVVVRGTLVLERGVSLLPWAALGIALCAAVVVAGWARRRSLAVAVVAVLAGSVAATVAGWAEWSSQPDGVGASPAVVVVPVVGLVAAIAGLAGVLSRRPPLAAVGALGSSAALLGWAVLRIDVLRFPVLPTELPAGVDRALTVVALALGLAGAVLTVRSGGLALPEARFADERGDGRVEGGLSPG